MKPLSRIALLVAVAVCPLPAAFIATPARAQSPDIAKAFASPPESARPETWWHWVSGNVTAEGITADLEAMKRIGLRGAQIFTVNQGPAGPVRYMNPEWRKLVQHAVTDADRLGLTLSITDCEGWSESGGPWITPELSMQKLVWTATQVRGGGSGAITLRKPATVRDYYADIAVVAFPTPVGDGYNLAELAPKVTSSSGSLEAAKLSGDGPAVTITPSGDSPAFVQLQFDAPVRLGSVTIAPASAKSASIVEVSDDGVHFRTLASANVGDRPGDEQSFIFSPLSTRLLRVSRTATSTVKPLTLRRLTLGGARIAGWEAKSGQNTSLNVIGTQTAAVPAEMGVAPESIVDLTAKLRADGTLDWSPPAGAWTVLRFGHTSTGTNVHPAMPETVGLECDKLSARAVKANWDGQMAKVIADSGTLAGKSLKTVLLDSWEAGTGNWTPSMPADFRQRRGYDLIRWLPALTGRVVGDAERTERFLWDYRRTMADLVAVNHYGQMQALAHASGMLLQAEAPGIGLPTVADELECKGYTDVPMGEFWLGTRGALDDAKEAASAAHIYGKQFVSTESFTATPDQASWTNDPYSVKALGDLAFCSGVNRYSFHRYAMQPSLNKAPGVTMGPWGLNFERTNTWWEPGKAWISYISRCEYLLQQGLFVADVCYYGGEGAPYSHADSRLQPRLPAGYDYDECTADALLTRMTVKNGRLTLPDGMSYSALVLLNGTRMSPKVAAKVRELVAAGLTVVGPKPNASPSLSDYPGCDQAVRDIANEVWGDCDGVSVTRHAFGKGQVVWGEPMEKVLAPVGPDFTYQGTDPKTKLAFIHRRVNGDDYYFVSNQSYAAVDAVCTFRAAGKAPEFWHPDTGTVERAPVYSGSERNTSVPIRFDPAGSLFVVFRAGNATSVHLTSLAPTKLVAALVQPHHDIRITKALYGVFSSVDVTPVVTAWLSGGMRPLVVDNAICGGNDPVPNVVKSLIVDYKVGDIVKTLTIPEFGSLALPDVTGPAGVTIVSARYGLPDVTADVTGELARLAAAGEASVSVSNALTGGRDPAPNVVKRLDVSYTVDGKYRQRSLREGSILQFDGEAAPVGAPVYDTRVTAAGATELTAWQANDYAFVTSTGKHGAVKIDTVPTPISLAANWRLRFPGGWGAPAVVSLDKLVSWTELVDDGAKHFSGTAIYETAFEMPANVIGHRDRLMLDLGTVKNLAEVIVNGRNLGVCWKEPFRVDVTDAVKPGRNTVEIKVTNLWPNRLIGDSAQPEGKRYTWTTFNPYKPTSELLPSGLLGPVMLRVGVTVAVE
ncbi:MAG TPA: glycosyl hydrolase [Capsulimonadaceae bacterium]|jgi:hypothetical protein